MRFTKASWHLDSERVWNDIYGCTMVNKSRHAGLWGVIYIRDPHVLSASALLQLLSPLSLITHRLWNCLQLLSLGVYRIKDGQKLSHSFLHKFFYYNSVGVCVFIDMQSKDQGIQSNFHPVISSLAANTIHLQSSTRKWYQSNNLPSSHTLKLFIDSYCEV